MFIGNTSDDNLNEISISFEGDKTNAIYASPLRIPKIIDNKMQIKQNLLVVPLQFPFNLLNFKLKYKFRSKLYRINVFLPYLLVKFCRFEAIGVDEFKSEYEKGAVTEIRTELFGLSKQFPPALLTKYIPNVIEFIGYKEFIQQQERYVEY